MLPQFHIQRFTQVPQASAAAFSFFLSLRIFFSIITLIIVFRHFVLSCHIRFLYNKSAGIKSPSSPGLHALCIVYLTREKWSILNILCNFIYYLYNPLAYVIPI